MTEEVKFLLSHRPSVFVQNKQMRGRLKAECDKVGIKARWGGCSNCISTAYSMLSNMFNYSFIDELTKKDKDMERYLFNKQVDGNGYRDRKGNVLRNSSPVELRKAVYEYGEAWQSMFVVDTIPEIKEQEVLKPTSKTKKTRTTRKKKGSSMLNNAK